MLLQTMNSVTKTLTNESLVNVIILLYKNDRFKGFSKSFDLEICGKPMWQYVELAVGEYSAKTTVCSAQTNIYSLIRPMLTDSKLTIVLFSDTPLITSQTIQEIVDYALNNQITCQKLPRGFVFDTEYVKTAESLVSEGTLYFGDEDFVEVFDLKQLEFVSSILKSRILEKHQKNGVLIEDNLTTFIDFDAVIDCGVVVQPLCTIKGQTKIGKNAVITSGSYLENAVIGESAIIEKSYVKNAEVKPFTKTKPFEVIEEEK